MPVPTAPSADLFGSPVPRGALSQTGKRSLSSGAGRRHAWDSRPTRGAIAIWVLLVLGGLLHGATEKPSQVLIDVSVSGRGTQSLYGHWTGRLVSEE